MGFPSSAWLLSSLDAAIAEGLSALARHERAIWAAAIALYGVGDTVTTLVGLSLGGVLEAGPVAEPTLEAFGSAGFVALKLLLLLGFGAVWSRLPAPARMAVPLALATVGALVTLWNGMVIVTAL